MTNTLYQNIQALGNRMATNLEAMGVSASFSDGGLTLADKILQIQHFSSGLKLYADKSVEQSGNNVKLSALLFEDDKPQVGKTVLLYGETFSNTYSSETTVNEDIGSDWEIEWSTSASFWICADGATIASGAGILYISGSNLIIYYNGYGTTNIQLSSRKISYKDGVITYNGSSTTNISYYSIDVTNLYKVTGTVSVVTPTSLTTDSSGVATYDYTCTGGGKKEFYVKSGSVVSEPYEVLDCTFYDSGTTGTVPSSWAYNSNQITASSTSNGTSLSNNTSTERYFRANLGGDSDYQDFSPDFIAEFDIVEFTGTCYLVCWASGQNGNKSFSALGITGNNTIKVEVRDKTVRYYRDGVNLQIGTTFSTANPYSLGFSLTNASLVFKNFRVYPI